MSNDDNVVFCDIMGLDEATYGDQFDVKRSKTGPSSLRIAHYKDKARLSDPVVASLRGVIYDVNLGMVIAATNFRSTIARANFVEVVDGKLNLATEFGQRSLEKDLIDVQPFEEGYAIRVFRWNGKTEFASNKSLGIQGTPVFDSTGRRIFPNANASRWGHHIPFVAQLNALLKMSEEDYDATDKLFPVGCNYSPFVYVFYPTHQSRLQDTLMEVNDFGFVNFIGAFQSWSYDDAGLHLTPEMIGVRHETPTKFENTVSRIPSTADVEPFILADRTSLTLVEVNNVLRYGVPDPSEENIEQTEEALKIDARLTPGESVRIRYWNADKNISEFFHVQSDAFRARHERHSTVRMFEGREIRQNLANQYKCAVTDFVELGKLKVSDPAQRIEFVKQIVPVRPADYTESINSLMDDQIITSAEVYTNAELEGLSRAGLEACINYCRMLMANPSHQLEELLYLRRFRQDWDFLLNWLIERKDTRHYTVKSEGRYSDDDQKTYDRIAAWLFKEAADRTYAKWPGYLKWFKEREAAKPYKQRRRAERSDFHNEQIRRILNGRSGRDIYALIRLARHDTRTDSKSVADMTAIMIPVTNFPPLKIKSKKGKGKTSQPSSRGSSRAGSPATRPIIASSSTTVDTPVTDLSQFF